MDAGRWQAVRGILAEAASRDEGERERYIDGACAGDAELRREVESLLAAGAGMGAFLEEPALAALSAPVEAMADADDLAPPSRIGPYEVLRELGHGGMGTVYLARRVDGDFEQQVAIKLVRRGLDTELLLRRFRSERQILAGLAHPHIARLHDGGTTADGRPYFVMEHVEGETLLVACERRGLGLRERLELFRNICAAVQHAHRNLVVHRDLKPGNILVTADGTPKLLDFGLARVLDEPAEATVGGTALGLRLLTPAYASPEQVRGERVTTATDVYSLGVVLYELIAGASPYRLPEDSRAATERAVCEQQPERPSARGNTPALRKALAGDLDNIVLTALRKEPERRYASVELLADDVRRYLEDLPVQARPASARYRAGKFVRRHRAAVVAAGLAVLSLAAGLAIAIQEARIARAAQTRAERRFTDVRRLASDYLFELDAALRHLPGATHARELVVRKALEYLERLSHEAADDPQLQRDVASAYERVGDIQGGMLLEGNLGQLSAARASYRQAVALRERLVARRPGDAGDRAALADASLALARGCTLLGDRQGARVAADRAVTLRERLLQERGDRASRVGLARTLDFAYYPHIALGDRDRAQELLQRSTVLWRGLVDERPQDREARLGLMGSLHSNGVMRSSRGERALAVDSLRQAVELGERLLAEQPADGKLVGSLAQSLVVLGDVLVENGEPAAAVTAIERALALRRREIAVAPDDTSSLLFLRNAQLELGRAHQAAGAYDDAAASYHAAIDAMRRLLELDPGSQVMRQGLALTWQLLAETDEAAAKTAPPAALRSLLAEARAAYQQSLTLFEAVEAAGALDADFKDRPDAIRRRIAALAGT